MQLTLEQAAYIKERNGRISGRVDDSGSVCVFYQDGSAEVIYGNCAMGDSIGESPFGRRLYKNLESFSAVVNVRTLT